MVFIVFVFLLVIVGIQNKHPQGIVFESKNFALLLLLLFAMDSSNIQFLPIHSSSISQLRILLQSIFPINYPKSFFGEILRNPQFSLAAFDGDKMVAVVSTRLEVESENKKIIYITLLGTLPLYREMGIGSRLLNFVEEIAKQNTASNIQLHVQTNNSTATAFYKNHGFVVVEKVENYYIRQLPSSAFKFAKCL